jgi:hypothetical protein
MAPDLTSKRRTGTSTCNCCCADRSGEQARVTQCLLLKQSWTPAPPLGGARPTPGMLEQRRRSLLAPTVSRARTTLPRRGG